MNRLLARTALVFALTLAACDDDDDPVGLPVTATLTSGTPITNISGSVNSVRLYRIPITAGAIRLTVTTSGGTGDVDLIVGRGSSPTENNIECEQYGFTNAETCVIEAPAAGDWYALLEAAEAYSGVTLTATISRP